MFWLCWLYPRGRAMSRILDLTFMPCSARRNSFGYINSLPVLVFACTLPGLAQNPGSSFLLNQSADSRHKPITITLKDALAMAQKNDPTVLAAAS